MRRKPIEQTIRLFQPWRCVGENDSHRRLASCGDNEGSGGEAERNQRKEKEKRKIEKYMLCLSLADTWRKNPFSYRSQKSFLKDR